MVQGKAERDSSTTKVRVSISECYWKPRSWGDPSELCRLEDRGPSLCTSTLTGLWMRHHREKMEPGARSPPLWSEAKPGEEFSCELAACSCQGRGWDEGILGDLTKWPRPVPRVGLLLISDTELQECLTLVKCSENFISCLSTQVKSKEGKSPQKNKK